MTHPLVTCARGWLGTRFHHQGRVKRSLAHRGGVDCLGLLIGIAGEMDLRLPDGRPLRLFDETNYTHTPNTAHLRARLESVLSTIAPAQIQPGDIVLLTVDDMPQHLAVVSDRPHGLGIIHAYAPARAVVEHDLSDEWARCIAGIFRMSHLL